MAYYMYRVPKHAVAIGKCLRAGHDHIHRLLTQVPPIRLPLLRPPWNVYPLPSLPPPEGGGVSSQAAQPSSKSSQPASNPLFTALRRRIFSETQGGGDCVGRRGCVWKGIFTF